MPTLDTARQWPTVLFVGDKQTISAAKAEILPDSGFTAITAPNESAALEIAALIPPDLLIADATVPGVKWLALAIALKHAVPDCFVLLLSGPARPAELVESSGQMRRNLVAVA